ncbi:MAG: hypothetical protein F6K22_34460 [Okeania sp. SIO2F4]|uniref:hypothetical protein n=1 Tax=Okeania sp. SIO2F4 TaxID=2607790 RepID=UPI0014291E7F|nr:hypothetical protein [Okeania sp. SIO2F4]NES07451.1 hypothetical protein [Okeania sp. SIO2F4]
MAKNSKNSSKNINYIKQNQLVELELDELEFVIGGNGPSADSTPTCETISIGGTGMGTTGTGATGGDTGGSGNSTSNRLCD